MSEIEVGEYVRTNNNYIRKIVTERFNGYVVDVSYYNEIIDDTTLGIIGKEDIKKHSKQLIDLIENKDVLKVRIDKTIMIFGIDEDTSDIKYKELIKNIKNGEYELLEILTHEQFEANCYKVGGDNEI